MFRTTCTDEPTALAFWTAVSPTADCSACIISAAHLSVSGNQELQIICVAVRCWLPLCGINLKNDCHHPKRSHLRLLEALNGHFKLSSTTKPFVSRAYAAPTHYYRDDSSAMQGRLVHGVVQLPTYLPTSRLGIKGHLGAKQLRPSHTGAMCTKPTSAYAACLRGACLSHTRETPGAAAHEFRGSVLPPASICLQDGSVQAVQLS
jgi:hypothetical protein